MMRPVTQHAGSFKRSLFTASEQLRRRGVLRMHRFALELSSKELLFPGGNALIRDAAMSSVNLCSKLSNPTVACRRRQVGTCAEAASKRRQMVPSASHASAIKTQSSRMSSIVGTPSAVSEAAMQHASMSAAKSTAGRGLVPEWITSSDFVKRALPWIGNGAYVALASGFVMTDILTLRALLVCGYSGLVAFHALHTRPLRIPLAWSAFFVFINSCAAISLASDRFPPAFTEEEQTLHTTHFPQLSPGQFRKLFAMGERKVMSDGDLLTQESVVSDRLFFILQGRAQLFLKGVYTADIHAGGFVNDVAFQAGDGCPAYGTIKCSGQVNVICWSQAELREHLEKDQSLAQCLHHVLVASLVRRLLQQRDQRDSPMLSGSGRSTLRTAPTEWRDMPHLARRFTYHDTTAPRE